MRHRKNPKRHSLPDIIDSIKEHGFTSAPMIDETTSVMVAGHGRCKALEQMKFEEPNPPNGIGLGDRGEWLVPVQVYAFKSERSRDAYLVADNRISEKGGYDEQALADLLSDLAESDQGLTGTGYSNDDLDELLGELGEDLAGDDDEGRDVDVDGHTRTIGGHKVRPPVQMTNEDWTLHLGDCLEGLRKMADNSVDSFVTDPPAGISFMGREWDDDKGGRDKWIDWLRAVMTECVRVLKPGGHGLVWSLPRTSHWTAMALELSGFQIRDRVSWLYITGFPKSLDIAKAIDKSAGHWRGRAGEVTIEEQPSKGTEYERTDKGEPVTDDAKAWDGWWTALKPACEDWWLVRKPPEGTIVDNIAKWGVGAINIGDSRIGEQRHNPSASSIYSMGEQPMEDAGGRDAIGRWPSHLIVSEGVEIDGIELPAMYFYVPKPSKSETEAGLDDMPIASGAEVAGRKEGSAGMNSPRAGVAKGDRRNVHPTKKPIALMRYLIRLITPRGGLVCDPFAGSGTTGMAALVEGCRFVGFEMEANFHAIASERLRSIIEDPRQADEIEAEESRAADDDETPADDDGSTEPDQDGFVYRTSEGALRELHEPTEVFKPGSMVESSTGGMVYVSDPNEKSTEH